MKRKLTTLIVLLILLFPFLSTPIGISLKTDTSTIVDTGEHKAIHDLNSFDLDPYFSWRDRDGVDFTTPIRNQAPFPSCETFAIVAAVETMVQIEAGFPFGCDLSEAHLFFWSGGNINWGSYPENDTQFLKDYGVPDEACWPYPKEEYQYPLNTTCPDWPNRTVKITDWSYLPEDRTSIKKALVNNGPVPTYFVVYEDFIDHKKGIYQHRWGKLKAPHYVTIVGYNDDPGYWICKNSWGTKYQDNGWFKIKYGECSIEKKSFNITGVYGHFPIIYVDDDNTEGPWDGSIDYPYQYIQEGIDNAYEGYTVYVNNGTYYENVVVNKTINLDGEDRNKTIIDGSGNEHVVVISSPKVRVAGFTIQNSGKEPFDTGIKTLSLNSNATIINNLIQNNDIGVFLNYAYSTSWNIVKENIIQNNRDGIYTHWANNNEITGNIIRWNAGDGIEMECSQSSTIKGNVINGNDECGFYLRSSSNKNKIKGKNEIQSNKVGIKLESSHKNRITGNIFNDNQKQAYFYNSFFNRWNRNYWGRPRLLPKFIFGNIKIRNVEIPRVNIDWSPRKLSF